MSILRRTPLYSLTEINDYIANYHDVVKQLDPENEPILKVMREVIQRLNEYLLNEGKGK